MIRFAAGSPVSALTRFRTGRQFRRGLFILTALLLVGALTVLAIDAIVKSAGSRYIVAPEDAPRTDAILVLGARVFPDGQLSEMLHDRLAVALDLYKRGKAPKILVSGDHGRVNYDEVHAMKAFLMDNGVPESDIFMDHAGFSTYESMYRARDVFQVRKLIVVTQQYHLMRSVFNARGLGLEAYGVASDLDRYRGMAKFAAREIAARNKDFMYVKLLKPRPTYLGDVIPITGDGRATND